MTTETKQSYEAAILQQLVENSKQLAVIGERQAVLETDLVELKQKVNQIETRLDRIETRLDRIETRLDRIETKVDKIDSLIMWLKLVTGMVILSILANLLSDPIGQLLQSL